jgi:hypothetical protein
MMTNLSVFGSRYIIQLWFSPMKLSMFASSTVEARKRRNLSTSRNELTFLSKVALSSFCTNRTKSMRRFWAFLLASVLGR